MAKLFEKLSLEQVYDLKLAAEAREMEKGGFAKQCVALWIKSQERALSSSILTKQEKRHLALVASEKDPMKAYSLI